MKVLFDHNVSRKLRRALPGHEVFTAEDSGFSVMITGDKNLQHQQNLKGRNLAVIVLRTTDWNLLRSETELVRAALDRATPGSYQVLS